MLKQLKELNTILAQAIKKEKKTIFFKYTIKIDSNINAIKKNLFKKDNTLYMNLPGNTQTYIGSGIRLEIKNKKYKLNEDYIIKSNSSNKDIITFGVNTFDEKNKEKFPWGQIKRDYFIIPKILFIIKKECTLNFNLILDNKSDIEKIKNYINNNLKKLFSQPNTKNIIAIKSTKKETHPNKEQYLKIFNKATKAINSGLAEKIVLSKIQKYSIKENLDIYNMHTIMEKKYKDCFNFIIQLNKKDYFAGSTPELILKLSKNKISTTSIAGTSTNKNQLNNTKEIKEQEYVTSYIEKIFTTIGTDIKKNKTKKLKLNYAYHLKTKISGKTKNKEHILKLLKIIHPTPALSGYPKKEAIDFITKIEPFNRGYYAGAVGLYNLKGEGNFYAGIRSALIKNKDIYLFSGGGITKESNYLNEWEETNIKLKHIKSILNLK